MLLKNYLFHRVTSEADKQWPPMKPELFESIISRLTKKNNVVLLEDLLDNPYAFLKNTDTFVTISFDDGYKDNIEYAAPILKKYKCPTSFYIVTNCIDANKPTWTYIVDYIISHTNKHELLFPFDNVPPEIRRVTLKHGKELNQSIKKIKPWLKTLSNQERNRMKNYLLTQCEDVAVPQGQMMSWDDIRELKNDGFYIGSHSHTHPMLASLESEEEIKNELSFSAKRIQDEIGVIAKTISYPVGSFDERVIRIAKQTGYKYGLAVEQKFFRYDPDKLFEISRVELYQEYSWKAQLRMNGIISTVKKIWK